MPSDNAKIWCPKQIPKTGLPSLVISLVVLITFFITEGSPGPLDKKKPSGSQEFNSSYEDSIGNIFKKHPLSDKHLKILVLIPKSKTAILILDCSSPKKYGFLVETLDDNSC